MLVPLTKAGGHGSPDDLTTGEGTPADSQGDPADVVETGEPARPVAFAADFAEGLFEILSADDVDMLEHEVINSEILRQVLPKTLAAGCPPELASGATLACLAAFYDARKCLDWLLGQPGVLDHDSKGRTVESFAAMAPSSACLDVLEEHDYRFGSCDHGKLWPADYAARFGRSGNIDWLGEHGFFGLDRGSCVGFTMRGDREPSMLVEAVTAGQLDTVKHLAELGAGPGHWENGRMAVRPCALHIAAARDDVAMIEVLLRLGVNVDKPSLRRQRATGSRTTWSQWCAKLNSALSSASAPGFWIPTERQPRRSGTRTWRSSRTSRVASSAAKASVHFLSATSPGSPST
jgi:hypothetical protein